MLTLKLSYDTEKSENLGELRILETSTRVVEVDLKLDTTDKDVDDALAAIAGTFGFADSITVDQVSVLIPKAEKNRWTSLRQSVHKRVLANGYRQRYMSPFSAIRRNKFKGVISYD
jgi:hypothetical protein